MKPVKMQDLPEEYWDRVPNYANCFANDVNFDEETMGFLQNFPKRLSLWNMRPGVRGGMAYADGHAARFRADGFKPSSGGKLQDQLKVYCSDGQPDADDLSDQLSEMSLSEHDKRSRSAAESGNSRPHKQAETSLPN